MFHNGKVLFDECPDQKDKRKERVWEKLRNSYSGNM